MYTSFLYLDLRQSIRFEEGEHIIRMWRLWLPYFLGTDRKNYSCEAANLMCNLKASFPKHIAYLVTHNRTVNTDGRPGHVLVVHLPLNLVVHQATEPDARALQLVSTPSICIIITTKCANCA